MGPRRCNRPHRDVDGTSAVRGSPGRARPALRGKWDIAEDVIALGCLESLADPPRHGYADRVTHELPAIGPAAPVGDVARRGPADGESLQALGIAEIRRSDLPRSHAPHRRWR